MSNVSGLEEEVRGRYPGEDSGPFVRQLGYVVLLIGILSGVLVISNFGTMEVPEVGVFGAVGSRKVDNPIAVVLGVTIMVQSVIFAAICIALGSAAENTAVLRREALALRLAYSRDDEDLDASS